MLKVQPRGKKGIYQVTGFIEGWPGRRIRESTGTTDKLEAHQYKRDLEARLVKEWTDEKEQKAKPVVYTFADAIELYLNKGGEKRYLIKLLERFGKKPLNEIGDVEVTQAAEDIYPGRSAATLNRQIYTPMTAIFRLAAQAKMCDPVKFVRPKQKKANVRAAPDKWIAEVVSQAEPRIAALIIFMTFTGARISEACRVKWTDLDMEKRFVTLQETKNGETRVVKLAEPVFQALSKLERSEPVFGYRSRSGAYPHIKLAIARAGVEEYKPHEFGRHAFARRLLSQGKTLKEVQEAGGWKSYRMVADVYGHMEKKNTDNIIENSGDDFMRLLDTKTDATTNEEGNIIDFIGKKPLAG